MTTPPSVAKISQGLFEDTRPLEWYTNSRNSRVCGQSDGEKWRDNFNGSREDGFEPNRTCVARTKTLSKKDVEAKNKKQTDPGN